MAAPKKTAAAKKPAAKKPVKKPAAKPVNPDDVPVVFAEENLGEDITASVVGDPGEGGDITPRSPLDIDPKVQAGGIGGAAGILVLWLLQTYAHVNPPEIVQGAILLIIAGIFAYFKKNAASA